MVNLKETILNVIRSFFHYTNRYGDISYAQEGEDRILSRVIDLSKKGFYVDVGAHSPSRCSNTYYFYKKQWRGINIDAMPGSMTLFKWLRKRDINLEVAIGEYKSELTYYMFKERLFNTFDESLAKDRIKKFKEFRSVKIPVIRLEEVLDLYLPKDQEIDFLSVDVEGLDLQVLKSNNWNKYKPKYIIVEILNTNFNDVLESEIYNFLLGKNYEFFAKSTFSVIFKRKDISHEYI
ncbi:FkbM family methyltransferase [Acinetobacter faecalis]|uniref:FkbM family methyltransferase n=1 Tax=Acinetobacter faecalis TaxID=2665161 RepID=UPI002A91B115|nr:FkbM family methyltransferase [Acinetobacter faecalis]MDY6481329.1 FkbM family methyltransferase [Acinetobacter faecalis]